jgi:hypothetical protein
LLAFYLCADRAAERARENELTALNQEVRRMGNRSAPSSSVTSFGIIGRPWGRRWSSFLAHFEDRGPRIDLNCCGQSGDQTNAFGHLNNPDAYRHALSQRDPGKDRADGGELWGAIMRSARDG